MARQNLWLGIVLVFGAACGAKRLEPVDEGNSKPKEPEKKPGRDSGLEAVEAAADASLATTLGPLSGLRPDGTQAPIELIDPPVSNAGPPDAAVATVEPQGCAALRPFDPDEVYIFGTLAEGSCSHDAVAHWSTPNTALVGFGCYAQTHLGMIRPSDGALIFAETFDTTYVFNEDGCVFAGTDYSYPKDALADDEKVQYPCQDETTGDRFFISPQGELALRCYEGWRRPDGTPILGTDLVPLAYDGVHFLLEDGVWNIETQTVAPFVDLPEAAIRAVRVADSGFWLALETDDTTQRWFVDYSGVATMDGVYAPRPEYATRGSIARLSGAGDLFEMGRDSREDFVDLIIRRRLSGESETVYTELDNPLVKLHISGLFTGP